MQPALPERIPLYSNRQVVYATLTVLAVLSLFYLLYRFSQAVLVLLVAIMLGTAIGPLVNWLNRGGLSRPVGVIIVYVSLIGLAAGMVVILLPLLTGQIEAIASNMPSYYGTFRSGLLGSSSRLLGQIALQMPPQITLAIPTQGAGGGETLGSVAQPLAIVSMLSRGLLLTLAVFVLGFYWVLESDRSIRSALLWVPLNQRESVRLLVAEIEEKLGGFLLGQGLLCLVVGVMALIAYLAIGLPDALVLAGIAGILEAVPVFGPILGAVPATLIALSIDPLKALWVVVATIVIQELENHLLVPRVMRRSVGVNPLVTLLALLAFTSLLGLVGALLAIPMAAILQLLINHFLLTPVQTEVQPSDGRDQLSRLRYEAQELTLDVRKQLRENERIDGTEGEVVDALEAIATQLDLVLSQAGGKEEPE